ncbi:MAG: transglutaminase family protein [Aristaeellaceae bacterium]
MRTLDFSYSMHLAFDGVTGKHCYQLRCIPAQRSGQRIRALSVRLSPDNQASQSTDGFGNALIFGTILAPHTQFGFTVEGTAELEKAVLPDDETAAAMYLAQTVWTQPGTAIRQLYQAIPGTGDPLELAVRMMSAVRSAIAYMPSSTTSQTTAEQAARQGCGVCQDHAQILLSLLRMAGMPCRYVAGLVLGEGRTHAWVEVWINGYWISLDPTNGMPVDDTHIVLAVGRDHSDCELNRGIIYGDIRQHQTVRVRVTERPLP